MIGFLVALIGASMGYLEAWALNPAARLWPEAVLLFLWDGDLRRCLRRTTIGGSRLSRR